MTMTTKEITLGQYIDAIEKNGLPQGVGSLYSKTVYTGYGRETIPLYQSEIFETDGPTYEGPVKITQACALGQGNINAGITGLAKFLSSDFDDEGNFVDSNYALAARVEDFISGQNDSKRLPLAEIAELARIEFADFLDFKFEVEEFDWSPWL